MKNKPESLLRILIASVPLICLGIALYGLWAYSIEYHAAHQALIECLENNPNPGTCDSEAEYLFYWLGEKYKPLIINPIILGFIWLIVFKKVRRVL